MASRVDRLSGDDCGVLLTGFDSFGGERVNSSFEIARRLHGWRSASGAPVTACELPTEFGRS